ncbi:hypothetical protein T01_3434 [Trichinella spiralis]|uniref:Uncharacterized protein n=1 Tax=Trichinella spiralis TaxID=6334 RepID=A0A0V1BNU8_TRISP|nr:hypothetical protein T01_3434 [Trichinella spiralis]
MYITVRYDQVAIQNSKSRLKLHRRLKEKSCILMIDFVLTKNKWEHCDLLIFAMQSAVHLMLHSYLKEESSG